MRYWIVSELFYPDEVSTGYVMTKIAERLAKNASVGCICGPSGYQSKTFETTIPISKNIEIFRVNLFRFNKNILFWRVVGFMALSVGIAIKVLRHVKRGDKLLLVTNPPTLLPFMLLVRFIKRFSFIILVHDVFPENAHTGNLLNKKSFLYRSLDFIFKKAYRAADQLIVVGNDMATLFRRKLGAKANIAVITNWADHEQIVPLTIDNYNAYYGIETNGKPVVQFAGNIGRVQGLDLFFNLLADLEYMDFHLVVIGDGAMKPVLERQSSKSGFDKVHFFQSKPRSEQVQFLNHMDIGLVTLIPGMYGLGVPSKVYNILAAGKPVLFIGDDDAEVAQYVQSDDVGWAFSWNEPDKILQFLKALPSLSKTELLQKGLNARRLVEKRFTKEYILDQYHAVITDSAV